MTKEEVLKVLGNLSDELKFGSIDGYPTTSQIGRADEIIEAVEKVNEPITLAEFLGWEEGKEYKCFGSIYRIVRDTFQILGSNGEWKYTYMDILNYERLRNAEKLHEPLYYAKIKGWELFTECYINCLTPIKTLLIADKRETKSAKTKLTKDEWRELGVNDEIADFERVEE